MSNHIGDASHTDQTGGHLKDFVEVNFGLNLKIVKYLQDFVSFSIDWIKKWKLQLFDFVRVIQGIEEIELVAIAAYFL